MNYTQEMFNEGIDFLAKVIKNSGHHYSYIIGVARGGLIPATALSYRLEIPLYPITLQTRSGSREELGDTVVLTHRYRCLVVDDIIDSGDTLNKLLARWNISNIDVACLVYNEGHSPVEPAYYHKLINKRVDPSWVTFWWD